MKTIAQKVLLLPKEEKVEPDGWCYLWLWHSPWPRHPICNVRWKTPWNKSIESAWSLILLRKSQWRMSLTIKNSTWSIKSPIISNLSPIKLIESLENLVSIVLDCYIYSNLRSISSTWVSNGIGRRRISIVFHLNGNSIFPIVLNILNL